MALLNQWFGIEPPYCDYGKSAVVIIPAPYEGTVSYGTGAGRGPEAVRQASHYVEEMDGITGTEPFRAGIHGREPLSMPEDPWQASLQVKAAVGRELETGRRPVTVGGEHSLTVGAVSAALERYPGLSVLQLDAHADLRDEYTGTKFSHACVMRRVYDLGAGFVQAGVRSMSPEEKEWLSAHDREVISARRIRSDG
ncbi:MAG: arginase family protein, partial [bacterium]